MKKGLIITIITLGVGIIIASAVLFKRYQDNKIIDKENSREQERTLTSRKAKELELQKVIEENQEKLERYNKIDSWNKEIIEYLE